MMPSVSGLAPRFALAPAFSAARSLLSGQSVGGRGLGGVGGVLFPPRQLPLQIRDLLFRVRDLLFAFGNLPFALRNLPFALRNLPVAFSYPTAKLFVLSQQPRILPMQLFPVELIGAPMAVPFHLGLPGPADRSRTHLFHSKRFGEDCPEKSTRVPELLPYKFMAAVDLLTQDFVVALTLAPSEGDPVYAEPVVVFVKFQIVESFIKGMLAAQGSVAAEERKGGTV
jgi:hypothetical protein